MSEVGGHTNYTLGLSLCQLQDLGPPLPPHSISCPPHPTIITTTSQGRYGGGQGECACLPTLPPAPPSQSQCGEGGRRDQEGACVVPCPSSPLTLTKDSFLTLALTFTPTHTPTVSAQISVKATHPREKPRSGLLLRLSRPHHHHTPTLLIHVRSSHMHPRTNTDSFVISLSILQ